MAFGNENATSKIVPVIESLLTGLGYTSLTEQYKNEAGPESGPVKGGYTTTYNSPLLANNDATIKWDGPSVIASATLRPDQGRQIETGVVLFQHQWLERQGHDRIQRILAGEIWRDLAHHPVHRAGPPNRTRWWVGRRSAGLGVRGSGGCPPHPHLTLAPA